MVVAFPDGGENGWYTDGLNGERYEADLLEGFLPSLQERVRLCPSGKAWGIGGFSMGGYGAVKIALKHSGLFGLALSHSGAFAITQTPEVHPVFGDPETDVAFRKQEGVFWLAEQALCRLPTERPRLLLDCGVKDHLLEASRRFSEHLNFIGYGHTYVEKPGEHTFPYWNRAIREILPEIAQKISQ